MLTDSLMSTVSVMVSSVVICDACSTSQVLVWKSSGVKYVMISSSVLCFNSTMVMNALNTSLTVSGMVDSLVNTSATNDVYPSRSMRCTMADWAGAVLSAGNWPDAYSATTCAGDNRISKNGTTFALTFLFSFRRNTFRKNEGPADTVHK